MGLWASIVGLVVITAVVAVFSEFLVASIDAVCSTYNISKVRGLGGVGGGMGVGVGVRGRVDFVCVCVGAECMSVCVCMRVSVDVRPTPPPPSLTNQL